MADSPDYEGYDDLVLLGRTLTPEDRQQFAPPADLWAKIAAEVGLDEDDRSAPVVALGDRRPRRRRLYLGAAIVGAAAVALLAFAFARAGDGSRAIDLDVRDLPKIDGGFYELWLIDPQVKGMVSMGPVRGSGRYIIPSGVGTDAFPIVDLSVEPVDGVPTHSGKSVLRGMLA